MGGCVERFLVDKSWSREDTVCEPFCGSLVVFRTVEGVLCPAASRVSRFF